MQLEPHSAAIQKVFGIGMHKTSTTSLANALYTLGYDVGGTFDVGPFETRDELLRHVIDTAAERDAVQDVPWSIYFRELDEAFPGSKFILTVRDPDRWLSSVLSHFGDERIATHELIYGVPTASGHEQVYLDRYLSHQDEVRAHFAGRPDDLLVMDISGGDGWDALCGFLGHEVPRWGFPRQNELGRRRSTRYVRAAKRLATTAAGRVGIDLLDERRVAAVTAYASVHALCRRFDAITPPAAISDGGGADHLAGMLTAWDGWLACWAGEVGAPVDQRVVERCLRAGDVAGAWAELRLGTRQWTGDLVDEGFGARTGADEDASDAVRALVNTGVTHWSTIASVFGIESFDPVPRVQLRPL